MVAAQQTVRTVLGLDIGEARTGVAIANSIAKIASPLTTITDQQTLPNQVAQLVKEYDTVALVVGLPRNLQGNDTQQTEYVRTVVAGLQEVVPLPVSFIDEAGTSIKAEAELKARRKSYEKADIDMLSATYILEDYLQQHPEAF